jgi:hypothetical protein
MDRIKLETALYAAALTTILENRYAIFRSFKDAEPLAKERDRAAHALNEMVKGVPREPGEPGG